MRNQSETERCQSRLEARWEWWKDSNEAAPMQAVELRGGDGADWRQTQCWIRAARAWAELRDNQVWVNGAPFLSTKPGRGDRGHLLIFYFPNG